ncbi:MAG: acyltransferase family protein [Candidatus Dormibacteraeota bacterium]|nr:acyltransferase family protein [Candidatus Dormibacteraeota bacterium]
MTLATERHERQELEELYRDVALEIRSRRKLDGQGRVSVELPAAIRRLQRNAPMLLLEQLGRLAATLRQATGREIIDIAAMMAIVQFLYQQAEIARREDVEVDEFGFDPEYTESFLPVFRWIYHSYWRVATTGIENVPSRGRALLVANHAGVLPWDGAMIKTALFEEHAQPRHARALVASFFIGLPGLSRFLKRTGQAEGHPDDAHRLLEQDELVLVFPEGVKGTGKGWSNRYRLTRFGRGGYVQTAIRAGAQIIPVSVVGSEEIYPMIADLGPVADLFGLPYFPVTPTFPLLGPLGMVPLPSKWRIQFHEPVRTDLCAPEDAADQRLVMTLNDHVRDTVQSGILENVKKRRGVFF